MILYYHIAMILSIQVDTFPALTSKLLVFFFYGISTKLSKLLFCSFFLRHRLSSCYFFVPILIDIHLNHLPSINRVVSETL